MVFRRALLSVAVLLSVATSALGADPAPPPLATILAQYEKAAADPGSADPVRLARVGTLVGAGLSGSVESWRDGDREAEVERLGPRVERTLKLGNRVFVQDSDGFARELRGLLLRRSLTDDLIETGAFARQPARCRVVGAVHVENRLAWSIEVNAIGGEPETLAIDAETGLPLRLSFAEDDGQTTIDYGDWRTVAGRRYPYRSTISDGDRDFDVVDTTTALTVDGAIDAAAFAPLTTRTIDMAKPQTFPVDVKAGGFLFLPVTIAGRTYRFLLDSGAQGILVDRAVASQLGLHEEGSLEVSGAVRTGGLKVAKLSELDVGNGRLRDIVVSTIDLSGSTPGPFHIDGILGYPFFAGALVEIDPLAMTIRVGAPGSFVPRGQRVPIELDRMLPEAKLRVGADTQGQFVIDTGNSADLLLYRAFVDRHPDIVPFSSDARRSYGIGGSTASYRTSLSELRIGTLPLYHVDTDVMLTTRGAFADSFSAGNVGLGVLRNFVLTFDDANDALFVERAR
jgi:hypothetical protein